MAEENRNHYDTSETRDVDVKDRGVFDFLGNKKDSQEEHIATDFDDKVKLSDDHPQHDEGEKKHSLLEKLHRSDSSSSSSSEEEVEEDGKKIRKKKEKKGKGLKEKVEEKIGHKKEEESSGAVPVEKVEVHHSEEKKGFLDKIKEKLPGSANKKPEEPTAPTTTHPPAEYAETTQHHEQAHGEAKEKKGILEKIKEKLPGYHPKSEEDKEKEKEKESASH